MYQLKGTHKIPVLFTGNRTSHLTINNCVMTNFPRLVQLLDTSTRLTQKLPSCSAVDRANRQIPPHWGILRKTGEKEKLQRLYLWNFRVEQKFSILVLHFKIILRARIILFFTYSLSLFASCKSKKNNTANLQTLMIEPRKTQDSDLILFLKSFFLSSWSHSGIFMTCVLYLFCIPPFWTPDFMCTFHPVLMEVSNSL